MLDMIITKRFHYLRIPYSYVSSTDVDTSGGDELGDSSSGVVSASVASTSLPASRPASPENVPSDAAAAYFSSSLPTAAAAASYYASSATTPIPPQYVGDLTRSGASPASISPDWSRQR